MSQDVLSLVAALPASPTASQLSQLSHAFVQACDQAKAKATVSSHGRQAGGGENESVDIRLLAKEAGPLAMGVVKGLTGAKQREVVDQQQSRALCLLCAQALDVLDTVRSALTVKGLELEVQRYNLIRRMTLAGHPQLAVQQGICLHAALGADAATCSSGHSSSSSSSSNNKSLEELSLACRLNLVVSVGEALTGVTSAKEARELLEPAMPALHALQLQLRASRIAESMKHAESTFKYLYKFQTCLAAFEDDAAIPLQGQLFHVFSEAADLVQQTSKLPKYAAKLASDLAARGYAHFLGGLLHYIETGADEQISCVRCLEEVLKALTGKGVSTAQLNQLPGWAAAARSSPAVGFVLAATCGLLPVASGPPLGSSSHNVKATSTNSVLPCQAAGLLEAALSETQAVLETIPTMQAPVDNPQAHKSSSRCSSSSGISETRSRASMHTRLREVWDGLCCLQRVLFERLSASPEAINGVGAINAHLAAAMKAQVALATQLAEKAKTWGNVAPFQSAPDATLVQPGLMAGLVACRLYASSAALAHMCATSPHAAGAAGTAMCQGVQQRPPKATPDADQGGQVQTLEGAVQGLLGLMEVADAAGLANADDLAWACSYLASAGNDHLRAEQWQAAASTLEAAVEAGRHWLKCTGEPVCPKTLHHLGKVCCAHVTALTHLERTQGAVARAAVHHIALLTQAGWGVPSKAVTSLLRQHVRARLQYQDHHSHRVTVPHNGTQPRRTLPTKTQGNKTSSAVSAATGGSTRSLGRAAVPSSISAAAAAAGDGGGGDDHANGVGAVLPLQVATLSLAEQYAAGAEHLGEVLDLCAYEEAALLGEEVAAAATAAGGESTHAQEVGAAAANQEDMAACLVGAFNPASQPHLHARALLAAALLSSDSQRLREQLAASSLHRPSRGTATQHLPADPAGLQALLLRHAHTLSSAPLSTNNGSKVSSRNSASALSSKQDTAAPGRDSIEVQQRSLNARTCSALCASLLALACAGRAMAAAGESSKDSQGPSSSSDGGGSSSSNYREGSLPGAASSGRGRVAAHGVSSSSSSSSDSQGYGGRDGAGGRESGSEGGAQGGSNAVCGVQAWGARAEAWANFEVQAEEAMVAWASLGQLQGSHSASSCTSEARQPAELQVYLQPQLCLQLLTQIWQIAAVQERPRLASQALHALRMLCHAYMVRPSSQIAGVWCLMQPPHVGCAVGALGPCCLLPSAAELLQSTERAGSCMQEVLQQLEVARCSQQGVAPGASATAATHTLEQCALKAALSPPTGRGQLWLLLRAQLHHAAAGAHFRIGGVVPAYMHAQEALKLSGAVFRCLGCQLLDPQSCDGSLQQQHVLQQQQQGAGLLTWVAASTYLDVLLLGARVFEACSCAEDAHGLLRECSKLAQALRAPGAAALAALQLLHISNREQEGIAGQLQQQQHQQPGQGADAAQQALALLQHCQALLPADQPATTIIAADTLRARGDASRLQHAFAQALQLYRQGMSVLAGMDDAGTAGKGSASGACGGTSSSRKAVGVRGMSCRGKGREAPEPLLPAAAVTSDTRDQGCIIINSSGKEAPSADAAQGAGLGWTAAALLCQLHLQSAECCLQRQQHEGKEEEEEDNDQAPVQSHLQAAAAAIGIELTHAGSEVHCAGVSQQQQRKQRNAWPVQEAELWLLQAVCMGRSSSRYQEPWPNQDGRAEGKQGRPQAPLSIVGMLAGRARAGGLHEQFFQALQLDSPLHPSPKPSQPGRRANSRTTATHTSKPSPSASAPEPAAAAAAPQLALLLRALAQCWQAPQLASRVCEALLHCTWAAQLPHAAAMFLHLQLGMGAVQQAAAAAAARSAPWAAPAHASPPQSTTTGAAAKGSMDGAGRGSGGTGNPGQVPAGAAAAAAAAAQRKAIRLLQSARRVVRAALQGGTYSRSSSRGGGRKAGSRSGGGDSTEDIDSCSSSGGGSWSDGGLGSSDDNDVSARNSDDVAGDRSSRAGECAKGRKANTHGGSRGAGAGVDLQHLETLASEWLESMLRQLPRGCAVTAVATLPSSSYPGLAGSHQAGHNSGRQLESEGSATQGPGLVVSRIAEGAPPLLLSLPPPPLETTPEWWRPVGASRSHGASSSSRQHQQQGEQEEEGAKEGGQQLQPRRGRARAPAQGKAAPAAAAAAAQSSNQEEGSKCAGEGDGSGGRSSRAGAGQGLALLHLLGQLLDDSSDSMKGMGPMETTAQKAQWWKARVQLDARMAELLSHMEDHWLGPWRVLLSHLPPSTRAQLEKPAAALAQEHFGPLPSDGPAAALTAELVLLLLAHWPTSTTNSTRSSRIDTRVPGTSSTSGGDGDVGEEGGGKLSAREQLAAVQQLCQATQQRADLAHAAAIVQALAEAASATAVGATEADRKAAGSSDGPTAAGGVTARVGRGRGRQAASCVVQAAAEVGTGLDAVPDLEVSRREALPLGASRGTSTTMSTAAAVAVCGDVVEEVSSTGAGSRGGRKKSSRLNSMQHHEDRAEVGAGRAGDKQPSKSRSGITAAPATVEPTTTQQALPSSAGAPAAEASATAAAASAELGSGDGSSRGPVLLVLQHALHALPWEGMPGLQATHTDLYRTPCLPVAAASAACLHAARAPAGLHHAAATHSEDAPGGEVASGKRGRSRAKSGTSSKSRELAQAGGGSQAGSQQQDGQDGTSDAAAVIDLHSTYFVLNPGGDLADTQACFQAWFADQLGWQGVSGHPPSPKDLTAALQSHAMFVYFGHGSGEQYLPLASLRRLHSCAANLLMGCSSGRLRLHGSYDPAGAVWSLLLAGCPAVVANLWDVTDRDIDRFSQALLKTWMGDEMDAEHEGRSSATAQRAKVVQEGERKGGSAARAQQQVGKRSISAAMSSSRGACRLPHLIGAAPVCYGLPTSVAWN